MAVYLIHFETKLHHAQHYLGYTHDKNLESRISAHRAGHGAKILAYLNRVGIGWEVVKVWAGKDGNFERQLKNQKKSRCLCPVCRGEQSVVNFLF